MGIPFVATTGAQEATLAPPAKTSGQSTDRGSDSTPSGSADDGSRDNEIDLSDSATFVRVDEDDEGRDRALQTSVVTFEGKPGSLWEGKRVDLFGVVHIGGDGYYDDINKRLAEYDVVLYELVAPDGTRIRPEDLEDRRGVLSSLQGGMKDMLGLEFQLEKVDYMAENFRHADMSPEEFGEDMKRRGDNMTKMVGRMMGASIAASSSRGGDLGMLMAMFSDDREMAMRRSMATQIADLDTLSFGMQDKNGEETLIKGRNTKAFEILKQELDGGKQNAAVFYGAGHLPDMAKRLVEDYQMEAVHVSWLDAWDLKRKQD